MGISGSKRCRPMRSLFIAVSAALVVFGATFAPASAGSGPTMNVGAWNYYAQCVTSLRGWGPGDILNWQTLPGEWIPTWPTESLRAGASIIRTDQAWFFFNPENAYVCNTSGWFIHYRDSRFQGYPAPEHPYTAAAVNDTQNYGWVTASSGAMTYLDFYSCTQVNTKTRADQGLNWTWIVGHPSYSVYVPPMSTGCNSTQSLWLAYYNWW